jgi:hypothetical protein
MHLHTVLRAPFRGIGGVHKHFWDFILENTMQQFFINILKSVPPGSHPGGTLLPVVYISL